MTTTSSALFNSKGEQIYQLIAQPTELERVIQPFLNSKIIAIDTETTGLDPHTDRIRLLQLAIPNHPVLLLDLVALSECTHSLVLLILQSDGLKVFHNGKFDLKFLNSIGVQVKDPFFDTMLASQLLGAGLEGVDHSLEAVATRYVGISLNKTEQTSNWSRASLSNEQLEYAANDAAILLPLCAAMTDKLSANGLLEVSEIEFAALPAFVEIELNGIKLDLSNWDSLRNVYEDTSDRLKQELLTALSIKADLPLFELAETINLNSPKQVLAALNTLGIKATNTSASHLTTWAATHPVVSTFLEYRTTTKALSTYIKKLPQYLHPHTSRLHPNYFQLGADTGRASCAHPPLQQIPQKQDFRSCFVPEAGKCLVIADLSQIELRVIAKFTNEPTMRDAYMRGQDLHTLTASHVLGKPLESITKAERKIAKSINFGLAFGMGAKKFIVYARDNYGLEFTLYQATRFRKQFFSLYPGLSTWHERVKKGLKASDRTLSGRRRLWRGKPPFTELVNHPIQGTAADILKCSLGLLYPALVGTEAKIIACVHDEILLECPTEQGEFVAQILEKVMVEAGNRYLEPIPTQVEVRVVSSWAEK
jgi:DNA polymerase-1